MISCTPLCLETGEAAFCFGGRNVALEQKQQRFCEEYLVDCNGTQAAIRAGYSPKTAREQAARLLSKVNIQDEIARRREKLSKKVEITAENVLRELALMAFSNMQDYITIKDGAAYVDLSRMTREQAAAIQEVNTEHYYEPGESKDETPKLVKKCKLKLSDKKANLELLGKHLGLFEKREGDEETDEDGKPLRFAFVNYREKEPDAEGAGVRSQSELPPGGNQ
ncbi:MAG: terminase small subunit [Armatimonadota bacterium]